jgi:uncharacterized membrane protein YfcA
MELALALGLAVGLVMGLTGAGGGILAVPALVFATGLTMSQAGPVGLLAVGIGASMGAVMGLRAGTVRYRAALLMAAGGIVMAPAGLWLAQRMDMRWVTLLFAAVLMWIAYQTLRESLGKTTSGPPAQACLRQPDNGRFMWTRNCARALAAAGAVAGTLSGLLGVGGGFVLVPAMHRVTDLDTQSVVATSLAVIALISLAGAGASLSVGGLRLDVALPFSVGIVGGMIAASFVGARLPASYLKRGFALICCVVAAGMVLKAL